MREPVINEALVNLFGKYGKVETSGNIGGMDEFAIRIELHSGKPPLPVGYRFAKLPDP